MRWHSLSSCRCDRVAGIRWIISPTRLLKLNQNRRTDKKLFDSTYKQYFRQRPKKVTFSNAWDYFTQGKCKTILHKETKREAHQLMTQNSIPSHKACFPFYSVCPLRNGSSYNTCVLSMLPILKKNIKALLPTFCWACILRLTLQSSLFK